MEKTAIEVLLEKSEWEAFGADLDEYRRALGFIKSLEIRTYEEVLITLKNDRKIVGQKKGDHILMIGRLNQSDLTKKVSTNEDFVNFIKNFF